MPNELTRTLAAVLAGYSRAKINLAKLEQEREAKAADREFQINLLKAQNDFVAGQNALNQVLEREKIDATKEVGLEQQKTQRDIAELNAKVTERGQQTTAETVRHQARAEVLIQQMVNDRIIDEGQRQRATDFAIAELQKQSATGVAQINFNAVKEQVRGNIESARIASDPGLNVTTADPGETIVITDQAGNEVRRISIPGPAAGTGRTTVSQDNFRIFAARMADSIPQLEQVEADSRALGMLVNITPFSRRNLGRIRPESLKLYDNAKLNFLTAVLRKESGAVINDDEIAKGDLLYFVKPGDTDAVVKQKQEFRRTVLREFQAGSGLTAQGQPAGGATSAFSDDDLIRRVDAMRNASPPPSDDEIREVLHIKGVLPDQIERVIQ